MLAESRVGPPEDAFVTTFFFAKKAPLDLSNEATRFNAVSINSINY